MNTKWDLSTIYKSINDLNIDIEKYKKAVEDLNIFATEYFHGEVKQETVEKYIVAYNDLLLYKKIAMYIELSLSVDTENIEFSRLKAVNDNISADNAIHTTMFSKYIVNADIDELLKNNDVLKKHKLFLTEQKNNGIHLLSPKEEKIIEKMKTTSSVLWLEQWNNLTSNHTANINGKEIPLSETRAMAYSFSKKERVDAYNAEIESYKKIEVPASFCLNGVKSEAINICKMHSYPNVLEMTVEQARISIKALNSMFAAIKAHISDITKYFEIKAKYLGYEKYLPYYELFAPVSENSKIYTLEQAKELVLNAFYAYSQSMGDFANNAFNKQWLDLLPKKGKLGGGFCEDIHAVKESRILINYNGSFNDVLTIAHEIGHAYHSSLLYEESEINAEYSMPIAETASNFCEEILIDYMLKNTEGEEKINIIENDLQSATQCIIDIYSRFLFEDEFFKRREKGFVKVEEINDIMLSSINTAYCNTLDPLYINKYMWICKPHYYDVDYNYYNFPYAFGLLLSKALHSIRKKEGKDFIKKYDTLFASTGSNTVNDSTMKINIDIEDFTLWEDGIKEIIYKIKKYEEILKNKK